MLDSSNINATSYLTEPSQKGASTCKWVCHDALKGVVFLFKVVQTHSNIHTPFQNIYQGPK